MTLPVGEASLVHAACLTGSEGWHHHLHPSQQRLAQAGIDLEVRHKRVKNINFRLKPHQLCVSVPMTVSAKQAAHAIDQRVPWALRHHPKVLAQYQRHQNNASAADHDVWLWGTRQDLRLSPEDKIAYYRQHLAQVTPALLDKWQPVVGAYANEVRFKKMHTRWGSCNTRAQRVWLSVYLPAYPLTCTEYVIVHELCHLHHPNHSAAFWQCVARAMPEYRQWHDRLTQGVGHLD